MVSAAVFGGLAQGIPQGLQDYQRLQDIYNTGIDQQAQQALGRTLQMLGAGSPMGGPNMGGIPQAGSTQGPPMAQGSPPMAPPQQGSGTTMGFNQPSGGPNAPFASRFPSTMPTPQGPSPITAEAPVEASDPTRAGGYAALYATMPGGQLPQQAQPTQYQPPGQQGWGPQGQQQQGQLDWRQILQAVTAANPGAPPQVIAGAVNRAIPLMNSQAQMEWKQYMMQMRGIGVDQRQQSINQRQEVVDAIKKRTDFLYGPNFQENIAARSGAAATGRVEALTKPQGEGGPSLQSQQQTERAFAPGGRLEIPTRAFNVVAQHLDVLRETAEALQNGQIQRANSIWQSVQKEIGSPVPTNFDAVKTIVANELNKAIIGGAGAVFDRAEMQSDLNKAQSPEQIFGVIQKYIKLAAGQLDGLERSYKAGSGRNDFEQRFISPRTQNLIRINVGTGEVTQGGQGAQPSGGSQLPQRGEVHDGYRFKGGDPAKKENWEKVSG